MPASVLHEKFGEVVPRLRAERTELLSAHADTQISTVNVQQAFGGARGVKMLICDTSVVEGDQGLIIRGRPILDLVDKLPMEIFWLLLTGEEASEAEVTELRKDLRKRIEVPNYVWKLLKSMGKKAHPMTMLTAALTAMSNESAFRARYSEGLDKADFWDPSLDDALRIIATIHTIAAGVYRMRYGKGDLVDPSGKTDMGAEFIKLLGLPPKKGEAARMMQLYLVLHSDHEGGNASAHTAHIISSTLADPFLSVAGGLNALAGPLHGLANQECLSWILDTMEKFGGRPSQQQIRDYAWETLNAGQVIPGYGHAVLRVTDPRFTALRNFGLEHLKTSDVFQTVNLVYETVPDVLREHGKAKNPWPNVDAVSGSLLHYYGLKEFDYYTVVFSVSRALGMLAQLVLNRAVGSPIERPKSVSTEWVRNNAG